MGSDKHILVAVGNIRKYQFVALVKVDGDLTAAALILVLGKGRFLYNAVSRDHYKELILIKTGNGDDSSHLFAGFDLDNVHYIRSLCAAGRFGDAVCLFSEYLALVRKHKQNGMAVGNNYLFRNVLFLHGKSALALRTASLGVVLAYSLALDISRAGHGDNA